jgi:hypothetical protein
MGIWSSAIFSPQNGNLKRAFRGSSSCKFGRLAKVKSIIRDMMHKVKNHGEEAELLFRYVRGH